MQKEKARLLLIIATSLFGLLLIPSLIMCMISPMLFDAPGSENNIFTWMLLLSVLSFPVLTITSIVLSWIFYSNKNYKVAVYCATTPLLSVALFILSIVLLEVSSGGKFAG